MNIVYINETVGAGSIGRLTKELAQGMENRGHTAYIFYSNGTSNYHRSIKFAGTFSRYSHAIFSRITGLQGYFSYFSTKKLIKQLKQINPDIIHLHNLHSNYINLNALFKYIKSENIATAITLHDSWFYTGKCTYYVPAKCTKWMQECGKCPLLHKDNINPTIFFDMTRKCLLDKKMWFDSLNKLGVIGVSEWISGEAKKSILKNKKIITIHNWIDSEVFHYRENSIRDNYCLENKIIVLMVSANISLKKGYAEMIYLAQYLPSSYKLIVIGRNRNNLHIPENVLHIEHTSNPKKLAEFYSAADICVNTTKYESFGMVTIEAMSCGTPVIVYNNTASSELIKEGCGFVADEKEGANGILNILISLGRKKEYDIKYISSSTHLLFNKEKAINKHIKLYESLIRS